jgi:uncharacterized protein YggU (UPF0235/DUF167 family)
MTILRVRVVRMQKIDGVMRDYSGAIKIKLHAPTLEREVNVALICFIARQLNLPRHSLVVKRNHTAGFDCQDVRVDCGCG